MAGDLTKTESVTRVIDTVKERFGGQLDILVNNADWCPVQSIKDVTLADYDMPCPRASTIMIAVSGNHR